MSPDYEPLGDGEDDEFHRLLSYAFRPQEGPPDPSDREDRPASLGERRGMYDGDDLLAVCRHHFWRATVRGRDVGLVGLAAVASPPEHRRRGVVAEMLRESLAEYRDRGVEFSALWPFRRSFYARYGWATSNGLAVARVPVAELAFADRRDDDGDFRRIDADEWRATDRVYRAHAGEWSLAVDRTEEWWRNRMFDSFWTDPYVYLYERDGEPAAYLIYRVEEGDDGREFEAYGVAWTDPAAFRSLLRFVYYHDSQVDEVKLYGRPGGGLRDLLDVVPDAGEVEYRVRHGPMVRPVDVPAALAAIPYPADVEERVVLDVSDPAADWNDGRFVLSVADGEGTCGPADGESPDATLPVGTVGQLAVGYRSARDLARVTGEFEAGAGTTATLGNLFPPTTTFLTENF